MLKPLVLCHFVYFQHKFLISLADSGKLLWTSLPDQVGYLSLQTSKIINHHQCTCLNYSKAQKSDFKLQEMDLNANYISRWPEFFWLGMDTEIANKYTQKQEYCMLGHTSVHLRDRIWAYSTTHMNQCWSWLWSPGLWLHLIVLKVCKSSRMMKGTI